MTKWKENEHLAFDVLAQTELMVETSPWGVIHTPHLKGYVQAHKGEFRLVSIPGEKTRIDGTSWYSLDIHPHFYWKFMVDEIGHTIHNRVLIHIKTLAEKEN